MEGRENPGAILPIAGNSPANTDLDSGVPQQGGRATTSIVQILLGVALTVYWVTLFAGTHLPMPSTVETGDKAIHFTAFFVLAMLVVVWKAAHRSLDMKTMLRLWLIVAAYAIIDELTQPLFQRDGEVFDWFADVMGSSAGFIITRTIAIRFIA